MFIQTNVSALEITTVRVPSLEESPNSPSLFSAGNRLMQLRVLYFPIVLTQSRVVRTGSESEAKNYLECSEANF